MTNLYNVNVYILYDICHVIYMIKYTTQNTKWNYNRSINKKEMEIAKMRYLTYAEFKNKIDNVKWQEKMKEYREKQEKENKK